MLLRNFAQIVFLIIVSVVVATTNIQRNCIYFEKESGFIEFLPTPVVNNKSVISMEVKAYNCDDISLTIHNGKNYILTVQNEGMYNRDDGSVDRFEIFGTCNGLWHEVKLELKEEQPFLYLGNRTSYHNVDGYDLNALLDAFQDNPLYIGIHLHNNSWGSRSFAKPFEGFIRNIRFDNRVQAIDQRRLNGTLVAKACPKDLIFTSSAGAALLSENVTFNDNFRLYFQVKITDCFECCSTSAILLSAMSDDSYFILEIVKNILYIKVKSQTEDVDTVKLFSFFDYALCDGDWHQIAVLQQGRNIRIIADESSNSNNFALRLNFTAPLYIGQHPIFKLLSAFGIRNGFNGCFRSLHINGHVPEIMEDNLNEFAKIGSCSKTNILF